MLVLVNVCIVLESETDTFWLTREQLMRSLMWQWMTKGMTWWPILEFQAKPGVAPPSAYPKNHHEYVSLTSPLYSDSMTLIFLSLPCSLLLPVHLYFASSSLDTLVHTTYAGGGGSGEMPIPSLCKTARLVLTLWQECKFYELTAAFACTCKPTQYAESQAESTS